MANNIKTKILQDVERHGLSFALETLANEASSIEELEILKKWLVEEFLKRKGDKVLEWNDYDFRGVENVLKDDSI